MNKITLYCFTRRVYEAYKNVDRPRAKHSKIVRER